MTKIKQTVEPFGDVNVLFKDDHLEIVASILMVPDIEGAKVGLALDASVSIKKMYGISNLAGGAFAQAMSFPNVMEPVAKGIAGFLSNFSGDGKVNMVYWACSPDGSKTEEIGSISGDDVSSLTIRGPKKQAWGRGTKLLPPLKNFMDDKMKDSPWSLVIFITDGIIEDIDEVINYCFSLGKQIAKGERMFVKLVLLGVGEEVDEQQMQLLDDMFEGKDLKDPQGNKIDLWCHKLASDMKKLEEVFAEVVSENTLVAPQGRILDSKGNEVKSYKDGLPAKLRFCLPKNSHFFTLEYPGGKILQDISEVFDA